MNFKDYEKKLKRLKIPKEFLQDATVSIQTPVMPFGKYRGVSIETIKKDAPAYINWILKDGERFPKWLLNYLKQFDYPVYLEGWAQFKVNDLDAKTIKVFPFGKHHGKSVDFVRLKDPSYCCWVLDKQSKSYPWLTELLKKDEHILRQAAKIQDEKLFECWRDARHSNDLSTELEESGCTDLDLY